MLPINSGHLTSVSTLSNYAAQDTSTSGAKVGISPADLLPILASAGKDGIVIQSFLVAQN